MRNHRFIFETNDIKYWFAQISIFISQSNCNEFNNNTGKRQTDGSRSILIKTAVLLEILNSGRMLRRQFN